MGFVSSWLGYGKGKLSGVDPAIRLLRELVAVDSVNPTLVGGAPGELEVAALIAGEMRRAGLDVSVDTVAPGRPNVVGVLEGRAKGRTLMFCGHTDTVGVTGMTDPFTPIERRSCRFPLAFTDRPAYIRRERANRRGVCHELRSSRARRRRCHGR